MRNLFRPPSPDLQRDTALALAAIQLTLPMSAHHRKGLPFAVRDLSRLLTTERASLDQPYWSSARLMAAYCHYFLPWNLQRLIWLLPNLRLSLAAGDTVLDLGSGPLTLPLALWITYPEWRELPLTFVCSDVAPHPLDVGRSIFQRLAGDASPWRIELVRSPLDTALRSFRGKAALITAGNVLNEVPAPRNAPLESRLEEFAALVASRLAPQGRFLAVEPGNRLGGKLISLLRRGAFFASLAPETPCPHWGPCPMLAPKTTGWCHFSHPTHGAPEALLALTERAKLVKRDLSLSCLLLRQLTEEEQQRLPDIPDIEEDDDDDDGGRLELYTPPQNKTSFVRILSDPIRLPDRNAPARYACSERGLTLVHDALRLPSGAAFSVRWPEEETRDPKTGALMVELNPVDTRKDPASQASTPDQRQSRPRQRPQQPGTPHEKRRPGSTARPRSGPERKPTMPRPEEQETKRGPKARSERPAAKGPARRPGPRRAAGPGREKKD